MLLAEGLGQEGRGPVGWASTSSGPRHQAGEAGLSFFLLVSLFFVSRS